MKGKWLLYSALVFTALACTTQDRLLYLFFAIHLATLALAKFCFGLERGGQPANESSDSEDE